MSIQEYKSEPCPICGHKGGWCGRREDGLVLCKRPPSPPEVIGYTYKGLAKDGMTAMYVEAGREYRPANGPPPIRRNHEDRPSVTPAVLETTLAAAVAALTPEKRSALAAELGLPENMLSGLAIGWSETAQHHADHGVTGAWVFPEYDGQGRLVGVTHRFPRASVEGKVDADGKPLGTKSALAGYRRGLTLPSGWKEMADPILIPEGPSDVLAGLSVGLNAIGRPSNSGGVEHIAQLCQRRQVIVLAENDRKPDGRWPGKEGAEAIARRLETTWGRPVHVAFPPDGIKDLRDWVRQLVPDGRNVDIATVRQAILDAIQPPDLLLLARPCDTRGRAEIKVFRRDDGVEAAPIHSDRLHIEEATARKRFVKAVVKVSPTADADDLHRRLLSLRVPVGTIPKSTPASAPPAPSAKGFDHAPAGAPGADTSPSSPGQLSEVFLPGGRTSITDSATSLGTLLSKTDKYYIRVGVVVTLAKDNDGQPILETIKPAALASVFETVAKLLKYVSVRSQFFPQEATCTEQDAKLIQNCAAFQALLPPIKLLSRCPVLIERDGALVQISGYDRDSGILAFGEPASDMPLEEAIDLLSDMLDDFRFATPADRARALAAIITPAMVFGYLLGGRAPVDLGEADASQTGKGYRNKITAVVYRDTVKTITQKKGGVGSLEETFATALIQGRNFISFDNVRGEINSPALESFLTEDNFQARVPHMAAVEVDPRHVIVQMTSNRAEITIDLANRSSCVRLLKQSDGYRFRQYPEGGILDHIRANQPLYLGAVFAVVKAWHTAGKPHTDTTDHDFRAWAGKLDWIVRNIFQAGSLLEGHRETQVRMATPALNWLRDVALAVRNKGQMGAWLRAGDFIDIISESVGIEVPGLPEGGDITDDEVKKKVLQAIGRRMAQCFGHGNMLTVDGCTIEREATEDVFSGHSIKRYRFVIEELGKSASPYAPGGCEGRIGENGLSNDVPTDAPASVACPNAAEDANSPYRPPMRPLCDPPMKTAISPIPPMDSQIATEEDGNTHVFQKVCEISTCSGEVMEPIGELGETRGIPTPVAEEDEVLFTASTPAEVLVELDRRGIYVTVTDTRLGLEPSDKALGRLREAVRRQEPMLRDLLSNPRRRWKEQAGALLAPVTAPALREDLLYLFDEREAIASVDGHLSDDLAGELAYRELVPKVVAFLLSQGSQANVHQHARGNDGSEHQEIE